MTRKFLQKRNRIYQTIFSQSGVTLFELMVAVLLLGMISTMIYSVLNVGITFADKGEKQILALEKEQGFLSLLHRQINSAWYNTKQKKIIIHADDDMLQIITHQPFLYRSAGLVLAIYRYDASEQVVYYTEKRDFYNVDYNEDYTPDFEEMEFLLRTDTPVSWSYDSDEVVEVDGAAGVSVTYENKEFYFVPKCILKTPKV